jgi:hypothetical protein
MLWREAIILIIYTDDTLITGPSPSDVDAAIAQIGERFDITHSDKVSDFLGINLMLNDRDKTITFSQPRLIQSIIEDLGLQHDSVSKLTPAVSGSVLHAHSSSPDHNERWNYRAVIGKLNFLEKSSRPDISFAVHQCARFCQEPKIEHTAAVKRIGRYLLGTKDKGIIARPDHTSLHCFCDASFAGEWVRELAQYDPTTARSRTGFVVTYAGCPVIWSSKLQTEIALSSTEAEYIALSQSLREVVYLFGVLSEIKGIHSIIDVSTPTIHCKVFEDNEGALEMARLPKMRPRTKHLNIKYHHFREAVAAGLITIQYVKTTMQLADIFTKALGIALFCRLRSLILGWFVQDRDVKRECSDTSREPEDMEDLDPMTISDRDTNQQSTREVVEGPQDTDQDANAVVPAIQKRKWPHDKVHQGIRKESGINPDEIVTNGKTWTIGTRNRNDKRKNEVSQQKLTQTEVWMVSEVYPDERSTFKMDTKEDSMDEYEKLVSITHNLN